MIRWGRNKPISSSSSSSGLSRALPVSWYSKLSGSSDLKPAKEKRQNDEPSQNMSAKSSLSSSTITKRQNDIHERSKRFQRVSFEREKAATKSTETFEEVKKKVRGFKRETHDFQEVNRGKGTVIMTPGIQVKRDKQRCERRDQMLLEQEAAIRTGLQKPAHQRQELKETKLREVKLKAGQQRKSLYIKRELNGLGTKEYNNKVRVFSPRASEKCRVRAIEDLKKAKLRAREHDLAIATEDGGGMESESFAIVKCSSEPRKDFRYSMIEMIMENGINDPQELKELLVCYLRLNTDEYHDMIIEVFQQVHSDLSFSLFW